MEFRILGSLEVESGGKLVPLSGHREESVLAALLLDAGRVVPMPRLVDAIWADDPPATAGKQVRNAVSRLRAALAGAGAPNLIVTTRGGYRLDADRCVVDAQVFEASLAGAMQSASAESTALAADLLRSALALWRGPALAGLVSSGLEPAAAAWNERRVATQELCLGHELALGRHQEIISDLASLVVSYPLREKLAALYMLALYRCDRQADALEVYRTTRTLLADDLGLDPGPELQRLHQQILKADPTLAIPSEGTAAQVPGDVADNAAAPTVPQVWHSLPADTVAFTGRASELSQITTAAHCTASTGGVVGIHAIGGMPGVGKTALAVHVAHRLRDVFSDRQLFIDLQGHTPGREPMPAEAALAGLLAAVGVDARLLPADLAGRAGLWRDRMAGQRALLVLDNAASSGQIAPLLPGGGDCLVLVTSRRHLGDLPGPVMAVPVDVLAPDQAREMFTRLAPRVATESAEAANEIVGLAGGLPLALSLLARVYVRHPTWSLADLAAETRAGVLTLKAEKDSVTAAFAVSYRHLASAQQRLFRHLGLHPGTTIDAYAAAALAGLPLAQATELLDGLHGEGLLIEVSYRRYDMHDLIRRYARDLAAADRAPSRDQALNRLLDYYRHTAATAQALLARHSRICPAAPVAAPAAPSLPDREQALAWARTERGNLLACLDHATRVGQHSQVVALTAAVAALLRQDGPWADALARHDTAVRATRLLGDRLAEADALSDLGSVRRLTGDYAGAAQDFEAALGLYCDLKDRQGQANVLNDLGSVRRQTGDYAGAAQALEAALDIGRDLGDQMGQGNAFRELGTVRHLTGDYPGAAQAAEAALSIARDLGDRLGQGNALTELAGLGLLTGNYPDAARAAQAALDIARHLGNPLGQTGALIYLGTARRMTGNYPGAAAALEEALRIARDLGDRTGQIGALTYLGTARRMTGNYPGAAAALEEALRIARDLGDRGSEAEVLNETGTLHRVRDDVEQAQASHQQALLLARETGSARDEACAVAGLGRCALAAGHVASARASLGQAREIFRSIGAVEADELTAELDAIAHADPTIG